MGRQLANILVEHWQYFLIYKKEILWNYVGSTELFLRTIQNVGPFVQDRKRFCFCPKLCRHVFSQIWVGHLCWYEFADLCFNSFCIYRRIIIKRWLQDWLSIKRLQMAINKVKHVTEPRNHNISDIHGFRKARFVGLFLFSE